MRFVIFILFFFCADCVFAQVEDSTEVVAPYDTTVYYEGEETEETYGEPYSGSTYTQAPHDLNSTKLERNQSYPKKKFSKTEWKRIVGTTNYAEDPEKEKEKDSEKRQYNSPVWNPALLKILGYMLIFVLIACAIFFLFRNAMQDKTTAKSKANLDPLFYDATHIDEVAETDLERLLREALERNDLRSAIRLYYIKLLKHLHSAGHIVWKKDKTNYDYANELAAVPFIIDFRRLMTAYEIIWYGERTPSAEEFKRLQGRFNDLQGQSARTS